LANKRQRRKQQNIRLAETNKNPAPDVKPSTPRSMAGEIGFTGTKIFAGLPMDEYNRDLTFPVSTEVYDRMRRSDGQVAAVLQAMKLPIRSTKWSIDPDKDVKDKHTAQQTADFIKSNLMGGMKYSWDDHLREALTMLEFGFSVFERVYRYDTWNGHPVVMLDKYAPRVASSIWRFPQDEDYNIVQVQQINYMTGQIVDIPLERCRVYTYNREGDNIIGQSVLRPAYKHWYIKDALYSIMSIGIEKTMVGTPYAKLPEGVSDTDRDNILNLLNAVRVSEESGFTIPEKVVVDMLEGHKNPLDAMPFIEHQDTMIARSCLAQFINLGTMSSSSGGSYALGNVMVDMFAQGLEAIANYIQGEIQKDIEQLVKWNFGDDAPIPKLSHKNIGFKDMTQVAQALYYLGSGHLVNPDEDMENYIRDLFGIPAIPKEALQNQKSMPPQKGVPDILPDEDVKHQKAANPEQADQKNRPIETHKMSEPNQEIHWHRDLTPYEKVVDFADINDQWTTAEDHMVEQMQGVMRQSANQLINQIHSILETNQTINQKMAAINALGAKYGPKYMDIIKAEIQELYQYGAQQAAKELGESPENASPPQTDLSQLYAKASTLTTTQMQKMLSTIQMAAINQLQRGVDNRRLLHNVQIAAEAFIRGPGVKAVATVAVGDSINIGRGAEAKQMGVKGAQWSAVMDDHTCPLCEELDGKTLSVDNPDFDIFRPPLHYGCRCILVFIGKDNTGEEYDWVTPPGNLVKKYGNFVT
jgi:SPP1 gp7 family putative phage head morphogenesis protein